MAARVVTFTPSKLLSAAKALEERIGYEFKPELVVGIASGGVQVAGKMFAELPHVAIELRRPSSKGKAGGVRPLLRHLPHWLADILRRAESRFLSRKPPVALDDISGIAVPHEIAEARKIIVIDDAVDSGVTLDAVLRSIAATNPGAELRSAAITVTTGSPLRLPDFMLYNNRTLIRFPWSADYRPPKVKNSCRR